jgi:hypothetical protein
LKVDAALSKEGEANVTANGADFTTGNRDGIEEQKLLPDDQLLYCFTSPTGAAAIVSVLKRSRYIAAARTISTPRKWCIQVLNDSHRPSAWYPLLLLLPSFLFTRVADTPRENVCIQL